MRLPRVRFTVRRMMIAVAVAGVVVQLSLTAYRVAYEPHPKIWHLWVYRDTGQVVTGFHPIRGGFWPRYWRRLSGQDRPGRYVCSPSCLAEYQRREVREVIEIASADDWSKIAAEEQKLKRMYDERIERWNREILKRLNRKDKGAGAKFLREETARQ